MRMAFTNTSVFLAIFRNSSSLKCARWRIIHQWKEGLFCFFGDDKIFYSQLKSNCAQHGDQTRDIGVISTTL